MLRRLLLMRHAKSSSPASVSDHERPLDDRGSNDAQRMGAKIKLLGYQPSLVLCSDSVRTLSTWEKMADQLDPATPLVTSPALYASSASAYMNEIAAQNFQGDTLLLIGHNPVIEDLILALSKEIVVMRPANLAVLELHGDSWKLVNLVSC